MPFVHLHLLSECSLLRSSARIAAIPRAARAAGMDAVALTDRGHLYGAVGFFDACREEGVAPILGCELPFALDEGTTPLVLLVRDETGYRNLLRLVTAANREDGAPPLSLLSERNRGLFVLSGGRESLLTTLAARGEDDGARDLAKKLAAACEEGSFFIELQKRGSADNAACAALARLARECSLPAVATADIRALSREDTVTLPVLRAIDEGVTLQELPPDERNPSPEDSPVFRTPEEIERLFADCPQALAVTEEIAARCSFAFDFSHTHLPTFPLEEGERAPALLGRLAREGLDRLSGENRLAQGHDADEYRSRMTYELLIIEKMGYCDYFLIVRDFVAAARSRGIPVGPGRGSGAGSLVAYLVGITEIDPLRYGLLFDRFLNLQRVTLPDFDIDFCYNRRDEVVRYVEEKYGEDHVTRVAAFSTLGARAALRAVGRALGMPSPEVDRTARLVPREPGITLRAAMDAVPALARELARTQNDRLRALSLAVEGLPRCLTTHAAGVVITCEPLDDLLPLTRSGEVTLSEYGKGDLERLGLLKFDFLALRTLTAVDDAEKSVRAADPTFAIEKIPDRDEATFAMLSRGESAGVFQFESPGMRRLLTDLRPRCLEDLMVALALYRPGPMDAIPHYLENRAHPERARAEIPVVSEILADTAGTIVYQEQVMQIFRSVAGYSYGRADVVRRAMAKKRKDEMERERETFLTGAAKNGVSHEAASRLFDEMARFADYAFNKSHAAAYATLSYRTAYLKAHYPAAYFAALLTSYAGSSEKVDEITAEMRSRGITLLPPDLQKSAAATTVEEGGDPASGPLRAGLSSLRGVGEGFAEEIVAERARSPFASPRDFLSRVSGKGCNRTTVAALLSSGAMDCFGVPREELERELAPLLAEGGAYYTRVLDGQTDLLSPPGDPGNPGNPGDVGDEENAGSSASDSPVTAPLPRENIPPASTPREDNPPPAPDNPPAGQLAPPAATPASESAAPPVEDPPDLIDPETGQPARRVGRWIVLKGTLPPPLPEKEKTLLPREPLPLPPSLEGYARMWNTLCPIPIGDIPRESGVRLRVAGICKTLLKGKYSTGQPYADLRLSDGSGEITVYLEKEAAELAQSFLREGGAVYAEGETYRDAQSDPETVIFAGAAGELLPDEEFLSDESSGAVLVSRESLAPPPPRARTLYLRVPTFEGKLHRRVSALARIFRGPTRLVYFSEEEKQYRPSPTGIAATPFLLGEMVEILGEDNVVLR